MIGLYSRDHGSAQPALGFGGSIAVVAPEGAVPGGKGLTYLANSLRAAVLSGLVAVALNVPPAMAATAAARGAPESFADLAAQLLPAVVNISTTQVTKAKPGRPGRNADPDDKPQVPPGSPFE